MRKLLSLFVTITIIGIGVAAVYFATTLNSDDNVTPDDSAAFDDGPKSCDGNVTDNNPFMDLNEGLDKTEPHAVPKYCPNKTELVILNTGVLYFISSNDKLLVKVLDQTPSNINGVLDTGLLYNKGDKQLVEFYFPDKSEPIGWISTSEDGKCGQEHWGYSDPAGLTKATTDLGLVVSEVMCWGDAAKGEEDFDFDDFMVVIAYKDIKSDGEVTPTINVTTEVTSSVTVPPVTIIAPSITIEEPNDDDTNNPTLIPVDNRKVQCGESCTTDNNCGFGYICRDNGLGNKCILNICETDGICEENRCLPLNPIELKHENLVSCVSGDNKQRVTYTITITNPNENAGRRENVRVEYELDTKILESYVESKSITYSGIVDNRKIVWNNLILEPNGGSIELTFSILIPPSQYGATYLNSVKVFEADVVRASLSSNHKLKILPCTAIISDQIDVILIGTLMVVIGMLLYKLGMDRKVGSLMWHKFILSPAYNLFGDSIAFLLKQDKKEFEEKLKNPK